MMCAGFLNAGNSVQIMKQTSLSVDDVSRRVRLCLVFSVVPGSER